MRIPVAFVAITLTAAPAVAGPLDTLEYRSTLRTNLAPAVGPTVQTGEVAYRMGAEPAFGVIASSYAGWSPAYPAYPSANFSVVQLGGFSAFAAAEDLRHLEVGGQARYFLDVEIRDAAGHVGVLSFSGRFEAAWSHENGSAWPVFDPVTPGGNAGAPPVPWPPSGSIWLGPTRYDVRLEYGLVGPDYSQNDDGTWYESFYAVDPAQVRDGAYWVEASGGFYAYLTPAATPEPGTLALAAVGLAGLMVRCTRRPGRNRNESRCSPGTLTTAGQDPAQ